MTKHYDYIAFFILFGVVCVLCYHMYEKEKELFDVQKEIRAAKEAQQMSDTADTGELQNYTGRLVISGCVQPLLRFV